MARRVRDPCHAQAESLDKHGHLDLSKQPAYGVCIRDPNGPSIAITGDTPCPPDPDDKTAPYADWHTHWEVALESDLFVCHLSTVPLTELRKLARIDATQQPLREQDRLRIHPMASRLDKNATRALAARNQAELKPFRDNLEAIQGKTHEIFLEQPSCRRFRSRSSMAALKRSGRRSRRLSTI